MVVLLAPGSTSFSGGYLYNQHLASELPAERFWYLQLPWRDSQVHAPHHTLKKPLKMPPTPYELASFGIPPTASLLIDSLYFTYPDWIEDLSQVHSGELAMLIHYLPSLDPTIPEHRAQSLH